MNKCCPRRARYSLIYNDLTIFSDDSLCDTAITKRAMPGGETQVQQGNMISDITATGQDYSLYPNPSDGNIYIEQAATDIKPVKARVSNIIGQTLYQGDLYFTGRRTKLNLQTTMPGSYLLELIDSEGRIFNFKFVIER